MVDITHSADPTIPATAEPAATPGLLRRIIAFPLSLLLIEGFLIAAAAMLSSQVFHRLGAKNTPLRTLGAALVAVVVALTFIAAKRWIERLPNRELALPGAASELALGLLFGGLLFAGMTGIVALLGGFEILGLRGLGQFWSMLALGIVSGVFEEVLFRGVLLRHLEQITGTWIALLITSALFGAGHIFNPGATWFAAFAIAMEAGIMLGAAYLFTRRLWLAIGIHAAWNFTQGWVFSVPVSGGEAPLGLLITRRLGPDWLTGGDFGLEASAVAMVVASLAGIVLLRLAIKRNGVMPPMWRR
jgi:membrane protease YdiL (CAAX protease family)